MRRKIEVSEVYPVYDLSDDGYHELDASPLFWLLNAIATRLYHYCQRMMHRAIRDGEYHVT